MSPNPEELYHSFQQLPEVYSLQSRDEWERRLGQLEEAVYHLLMHHSEQLAWLLYRIDVREQDSRRAFEENDSHKIAAALTQLMWLRQLEKFESRKKYKSPEGGDY